MKVSLSLSPVLFHYTSVANLSKVLTTNTFELTASDGNGAEQMIAGNHYYLSTTRHKLGSYSLRASSGFCLITLDGAKLSNNYKGKAVDYWGQEYYSNPQAHADRFEAEDRIISTKVPFIKNASKYIQRVDIIYLDSGDYDEKAIRKAALILKQKNIPFYIFDNKEDWLAGNVKKAIDLKPFLRTIKLRKYRQFPKEESLKPWLELYKRPVSQRSGLSKEAASLLSKIGTNNYYAESYGRELEGDIKMARKEDRNSGRNRNDMDALVRIMRTAKITAKQFVVTMQNKWD